MPLWEDAYKDRTEFSCFFSGLFCLFFYSHCLVSEVYETMWLVFRQPDFKPVSLFFFNSTFFSEVLKWKTLQWSLWCLNSDSIGLREDVILRYISAYIKPFKQSAVI